MDKNPQKPPNTSEKTSQKKERSRKLPGMKEIFSVKNLYTIAAIALGAYLLIQTFRSLNITYQKLEIFELARQEVQELRVENIELILLSERVVSEEYIESAARDRLNYAKDGEILFIIPEELLEDPKLTEYVGRFSPDFKVVEVTDKSNLEVWLEFFRYGV